MSPRAVALAVFKDMHMCGTAKPSVTADESIIMKSTSYFLYIRIGKHLKMTRPQKSLVCSICMTKKKKTLFDSSPSYPYCCPYGEKPSKSTDD